MGVKIRDLYTQEFANTEKGTLYLYERGGAFGDIALARVIGDKDGDVKEAIHVNTSGDISCGDHAAIPIEIGDHVVEVKRHGDNITVSIGEISDIRGNIVSIRGAARDLNCGRINDMLDAGLAKSYDCHCRRSYYIKIK